MGESLWVDPEELRRTAGRLDDHASEFASDHRKAHSAAGQVRLGSGLAGAALPEMLAGWEADGSRFGEHFSSHAADHRTGAAVFVNTDQDRATGFTNTGA